MGMRIGTGIGIGRSSAKRSWSSYWNQRLTPTFDKFYWGWQNEGLGGTKRDFQVCYKIPNSAKGVLYDVRKNSDAHYDVTDISYVDLTFKMVGARGTYSSTISDDYRATGDRFACTGTGIKVWVLKGTSRGIMGCLRYDGNFGGRISTDPSSQYFCRTFKAEDDYFYVYDSGDYSSISPSFNALAAGDLIHYKNAAWTRILAANVNYAEIDCYAGSSSYVESTAFTGLPSGSYKFGFFATLKKNASSSGFSVVARRDATNKVSTFTAEAIAPTTYNSYSLATMVDLIGDAGHWEMSTRIKRNGTAQTAQWIPAHGGVNTLTNHTGEDITITRDGTAITGAKDGSEYFTEVTNSVITKNITYAINTAVATDELLKVTTDLTFSLSGINIKNTYECLIETLATTIYSFMLPYSTAIWNKFLSDQKQELTLPASGNTANLTNGPSAVNMLVYNDTASGSYENLCIKMEVINPSVTNRGTSRTFSLNTYGANYGKMYADCGSNEVLSVGSSWVAEFNMKVGYVADLINSANKIA